MEKEEGSQPGLRSSRVDGQMHSSNTYSTAQFLLITTYALLTMLTL